MRCCEESEFEIVAGDDFGFDVEILNTDNTPAELDGGDSIEAVIHDGGEERILKSRGIAKNTASFYLSSDFTRSLLKDNRDACYLEMCVRVSFANGGRNTVIRRFPLTIRRC